MPALPLKNGLPKLLKKIRGAVGRFQAAKVFSQNLHTTASAEPREGRVDILDNADGAGDYYGFLRLLNRRHQERFLCLRLFAPGNLNRHPHEPNDQSGFIADRKAPVPDPANGTIRDHNSVFMVECLSCLRCIKNGMHLLTVIGMDGLEERFGAAIQTCDWTA